MKKRMTFSLDSDVIENIVKMSALERRSVSGFVNQILSKALVGEPNDKQPC